MDEPTKKIATNPIEIFENSEFGSVRTIVKDDGTPLFCGIDVAIILGYKKPRNAVATHCKSAVALFQGSVGTEMNGTKFISESDVYRLIMRSKLSSAERFQDWVCEEVLPTLRKHGTYTIGMNTNSYAIDDEVERAIAWAKERKVMRLAIEDNKRLEKENKELKPKAWFYDVFMNCGYVTSIRDFSIQLCIKENELINYLIGINVLYRSRNKSGTLRPYKSKTPIWFQLRDHNDTSKPGNKVMITPRGKAEIYKMLCNAHIIDPDDVVL